MDLLLPQFVAPTEMPCQEITWGAREGPASSPGFICSPSTHCVLGLRPQVHAGLSALVCQCVCTHVFIWFCFLWKENKLKANTACISTSPRAVETSNCPGQEGFPVGLNVHVQSPIAAGGLESLPQREVSGDPERTAWLWVHPCLPSELTPNPTPILLSGLKLRPPARKGSPEIIQWAGGRVKTEPQVLPVQCFRGRPGPELQVATCTQSCKGEARSEGTGD